MATVNLFNANSSAIKVNVNNSDTIITLAAPNATTWAPGTTTTAVAFNPGNPTPGAFGLGTNSVTVNPSGSSQAVICPIVLPNSVNWVSLQIYFFFQTMTSCAWVVLNNGQQVSSGSAAAPSALAEMEIVTGW